LPGVSIRVKSLNRPDLNNFSMPRQDSRIKILDQMRQVLRPPHYSIHTERIYLDWIKRYIAFHRMKSRDDLAKRENKIGLPHSFGRR
jgi:Phage integrase, N-terminal SAM-like domain